MDTCLPSVDHMKNIAHRVSTYLSNDEGHLCTHVNKLLSTGVSLFYGNSYREISQFGAWLFTANSFK